ncbi:hypothetical protein T484DRAFT_1823628 [Baffinella frigidus]|nr:hypothetical protein T484DRAFT_1823628 [Cryptophyta sp. CCMP2293]
MNVVQGTGRSALGAFRDLSPRCQGLGFCCFCSTCGIVVYYNVILAWSLRYLFATLASIPSGELPWGDNNSSAFFQGELPWRNNNSSAYFQGEYVQGEVLNKAFLCKAPGGDYGSPLYGALNYDEMEAALLRDCKCRPAGLDYPGGFEGYNIFMLCIIWALVLTMWSLVMLMCFLGTRSLKYAVYITVPLPYVMLVLLFVRGVTLPGAEVGLRYYLQPDMSRLFFDKVDPETGEVSSAASVWLQACTQTFFSLSLGQGAMITYSSYNPPSFPITKNVLTIALINSGTEFFAGLVVFSILGYLSEVRGVPIDQVVAAGPGLVFEVMATGLAVMPASPDGILIVMPTALALMPAPVVMSFFFFLMLLMLGLTSAARQGGR